VQLPSDTTCSCRLYSLPSGVLNKARSLQAGTVPAAGVGKVSLLARERASLNVATDLFRTAVTINIPHAAVNVKCGAHSYDAVQKHHEVLAIKNVIKLRSVVGGLSEISVNENHRVHIEVQVLKVGSQTSR
jgi:hypothetical protein